MTDPSSSLAVRQSPGIIPAQEFSKERIDLIRATIMPRSSDVELELFVEYARRTGLDPFRKQIYAIPVWDERAKRNVYQFMVGIDGLRLVAVRTGQFDRQEGPFWKSKGGEWADTWEEDGPPFACKVGVRRKGASGAVWGVVHYASFVRKNRQGAPMGLWGTAPEHMLSIRAESHALRKCFPAETAGLYVDYGDDDDGAQSKIQIVNPDAKATNEQLAKLHLLARDLGWGDEQRHAMAGVGSFAELTKGQASDLINLWQEAFLDLRVQGEEHRAADPNSTQTRASEAVSASPPEQKSDGAGHGRAAPARPAPSDASPGEEPSGSAAPHTGSVPAAPTPNEAQSSPGVISSTQAVDETAPEAPDGQASGASTSSGGEDGADAPARDDRVGTSPDEKLATLRQRVIELYGSKSSARWRAFSLFAPLPQTVVFEDLSFEQLQGLVKAKSA